MSFDNENTTCPRPRLSFWTDVEIRRVHNASLSILEKTGMEFHSPAVVAMLADAGARVTGDQRVRIPAQLVENALGSVNKQVVLYNRKGEPVMPLKEMQCHFGPGSETPFTLDPYSGVRRECLVQDVARAALVVDALPNIDFGMSFASASDVTKGCEDAHHFAQMVLNTEKPLIFTTWDLNGIEAVYDMACAVAGSADEFRAQPFICHYVEPVTPLRHPRESLDKLVFSVEKGIPAIYVPVSTAGGTTPVTFAGSFAVTNAEFLAGLVVSQLVREGSTLIYGGGPNPLDLSTAVLPYASPETFMSRCIRAEIARFYGLPCFSTGGTSDAKVLDVQAGYEAGMGLLMAALSGCNFIHDVGYMEMGYTSSLELLAMCDEFIAMIRRILCGFAVSDDTLALDVIDRVGPGGNFLQEGHTFEHFRREIWVSRLLDRNLFDAWSAKGAKDMRQRAKEKVLAILDTHRAEPLPEAIRGQIEAIVRKTDDKRSRG